MNEALRVEVVTHTPVADRSSCENAAVLTRIEASRGTRAAHSLHAQSKGTVYLLRLHGARPTTNRRRRKLLRRKNSGAYVANNKLSVCQARKVPIAFFCWLRQGYGGEVSLRWPLKATRPRGVGRKVLVPKSQVKATWRSPEELGWNGRMWGI